MTKKWNYKAFKFLQHLVKLSVLFPSVHLSICFLKPKICLITVRAIMLGCTEHAALI
jgi:hypothetical protein